MLLTRWRQIPILQTHSGDQSIKNPKLDARKLWEKGETQVITKEEGNSPSFWEDSGSSEVNKNKFNPVTKKEEPQEGFSPKDSYGTVLILKILTLICWLICQKKREKFISLKKIRSYWAKKDPRFVNFHKLIFSMEILIFA